MEAVLASLPELDAGRRQHEAPPVRRTRNRLSLVEPLDARGLLLQLPAASQRTALARRLGADLAPPRPRGKVLFRFAPARARDGSLDPHLAVERSPVKGEGGAGVPFELAPLAARVVRKEHEAAGVNLFEQDDARRRRSVRRRRDEVHGFRMLRLRRACLGEPAVELFYRIG